MKMYITIKRIFDLIFSVMGILFLLPLFTVIIILLRLTGDGEVFYFQERVGYKGRVFNIIKFATMLKNSPNIGSKTITTRNDPRITKVGKLLRITKINELPQILNVIKGDMSLVGPRPLLKTSFAKYKQEVQSKIYEHRPGITGIGSLIFRDEEKLVTTVKNMGLEPLDYYKDYIYPYKGDLEMWYYDHISFTVDIKILILTFWSILFPKNEAAFKVFKSLPPRPETLTLAGIASL